MTIEYTWVADWLHSHVDANQVGAELDSLRDGEYGSVNPSTVIEWAREHQASALHKCIDWDDESAAHKFRLEQVRHVMRNIRVKEINGGDVVVHRQWFKIASVGYVSRDTIINDERLSESLLARARQDLISWRHRYAEIQSMNSAALEAVDVAIDTLSISAEDIKRTA